jgi:hypothetical protein
LETPAEVSKSGKNVVAFLFPVLSSAELVSAYISARDVLKSKNSYQINGAVIPPSRASFIVSKVHVSTFDSWPAALSGCTAVIPNIGLTSISRGEIADDKDKITSGGIDRNGGSRRCSG